MVTRSECEISQSWRTQFSSHGALNLNRAVMPPLTLHLFRIGYLTLSRQVESDFWCFPWPSSSRRLDLVLNRIVRWACSSLQPWCHLAIVLVVCVSFLHRHPFPTSSTFPNYFPFAWCVENMLLFLYFSVSSGLVALISSITDLLVLLAVHGILSSRLQQTAP